MKVIDLGKILVDWRHRASINMVLWKYAIMIYVVLEIAVRKKKKLVLNGAAFGRQFLL